MTLCTPQIEWQGQEHDQYGLHRSTQHIFLPKKSSKRRLPQLCRLVEPRSTFALHHEAVSVSAPCAEGRACGFERSKSRHCSVSPEEPALSAATCVCHAAEEIKVPTSRKSARRVAHPRFLP